jgi:hypothetical protein
MSAWLRISKRVQIGLIVAIAAVALFSSHTKVRAGAPAPATPIQVTVAVTVSDSGGGKLSYQWRATDGTIVAANAASTTWTLPDGPGLHFAYVLVSNGRGGYTERRVAVNTDTIGNPPVIPPPTTLSPPKSSVPKGNSYRSFLEWGSISLLNRGVRVQQIPAYVLDTTSNKHYPPTGTVSTNGIGGFMVQNVPALPAFATHCSVDGGATFPDCTTNGPSILSIPAVATSDYVYGTPLSFPPVISGSLALADGSPCGTSNEFFNVHVTATATLLDSFGVKLAGPAPLNELGDFSLPYNANAATAQLKCQGAPVLNVPITSLNAGGVTDLGQTVLTTVKDPVVSNMTATFGTTSVGIFLPPVTGQPSDIVPRSDAFLAEKGLDTRIEACQYYVAIGATKSCSAAGDLVGSISFDDWQRMVKMGKYAVGATEYVATYVNKVDLNLTRVHHSISYGSNNTAAYVCNHLGPASDSQADINTAVANAAANLNLVACVAMDYMVHTGVNGGVPFTRFYIFGPSGQLLPSVNLDTRREKFVPGTCVVCHGGDHYAGNFPKGGKSPDVGGHFLPYDAGNFEFSSKSGFTEANQEAAIYSLNQNVLNAGPTGAETDLISGWYATSHTLNKNYVPPSWSGQSASAISFYQNVIARSCRTCHVAMVEGYNFDHYANITPGGQFYRGQDATLDVGVNVCGGQQVIRAHSMPNSLVTFNRFWNSSGTSVDQPLILSNFFGSGVSPTGTCTKGLIP